MACFWFERQPRRRYGLSSEPDRERSREWCRADCIGLDSCFIGICRSAFFRTQMVMSERKPARGKAGRKPEKAFLVAAGDDANERNPVGDAVLRADGAGGAGNRDRGI